MLGRMKQSSMSQTIEQGKEDVAKLCQYFTTNRQAFLARNEAQVRQSLIDPLFEGLGWDVRNRAMTAPQYREVIPEDSLDVEGQQKAPRVAPTSRFAGPLRSQDGPWIGRGDPSADGLRVFVGRIHDKVCATSGLMETGATCLIDHKWRYNANVSVPQSFMVSALAIEGGFAIREGVNWGRASTAADSRLQVLLLQFGRSRGTSHSRCPGGPLGEVLARSLDLGIEPGFSKSRIDGDSRTRTGKSRLVLGEMECLL